MIIAPRNQVLDYLEIPIEVSNSSSPIVFLNIRENYYNLSLLSGILIQTGLNRFTVYFLNKIAEKGTEFLSSYLFMDTN